MTESTAPATADELDDFGRRYLTACLELNKHLDGLVDAYYGPADFKESIANAPPVYPQLLVDDVLRLQNDIPGDNAARLDYLQTMLRSLETSARIAAGESFEYLDEVALRYDIEPVLVPESDFEAAITTLDKLLPPGDPGEALWQRLESSRKRYEVRPDNVLDLLELARIETRKRTAEFVALPDEEAVEVRLTSDQPWGAYNWYLGNGRSLIEFNTDIPTNALFILGTFAHEGYPGHHTEAILKEQVLLRQKGYAEHAVVLLLSPAAVISEGIATTATQMIFPNGSNHDWTADVLLPAAGLGDLGDSADFLRELAEASRSLRHVTGNAAILYHTGQLNEEETIDYIRTYALANPDRAAKSFSFLSHPVYRTYGFTYTHGYELIMDTAKPQEIFKRLLVEQITPSALAAM